MIFKKFIPIYVILSFLSTAICYDHGSIKMLMSFLTYENTVRQTTLLAPGLCWSAYYKNVLAKKLFGESIGIASSFQPNRTERFLQHNVVFMDLNCPGAYDLIMMANKNNYFKSPYRWLIVGLNHPSVNMKVLSQINILVDSDVVLAERMSKDEYVFTEVYKISATSDVIKLPRGLWQASSSLMHKTKENNTVITKQEKETNVSLKIESQVKQVKFTKYGVFEDHRESKVLSSRRHNLQRHVLTMANVLTDSNETRQHLDDRLNLHQDSIAKMSYMVVKICFEMLNATEKRVFTHTWGYRDQHGNWQGLVKMLLNKEADLGTLAIFTKDRMKNIDYIAMVGTTAVRFVFREPPLSYVSNIFALPFTGAVWLAILICVLGCSVFLYITSKWEASMGMHPLQLDGSWADVLILIIGAVLQQGCTLEPRYAAGRCVTVLLFIALTILYAAYSANIVVLLRAPSSSVRTLPDLLNSPLKLGASDFEYNRYFFKKLNDPIRKSIYDKKIAPKGKKPNFYSMKDGIEKIRQGLFAFHMELNPGYRLIQDTYQEDEKCDLVEIDYINEIDPWVPGQKRSPHRDLFKINFMKIRESGIQSCIQRRLHVPRPRCSGTVSTFSSVGIPDIYPALLITLYGFLVAPATLLLEIAYKRLLKIRQNRMVRKVHFIN